MSKPVFEVINRDKNGSRSGILNTRRGLVKTPFFMPVATRSAVKGLTPQDVAGTGAQVLLSNTYHLHLQPGEKLISKLGGLHVFGGWEGPILTDSGGFQVFSLAMVRKITEEGVWFKNFASGDEVLITPEKSMQIQFDLGSDIIMAFDDVTGLSPEERGRTDEALERTHRWLERCVTEFTRLVKERTSHNASVQGGTSHTKRPLLFGIAQGGLNKKLRKKSVEFVQSTSVDGVAIGGLSVGESRKDMYEMLEYLAPIYDSAKVRYLMGVGEPKDMRFAIEHGIDMFDCVMPTRNARHGSLWITAPAHRSGSQLSVRSDIKLNLNSAVFAKDSGPIDQKCDCQTCLSGYSRAFLRHLFKIGDPLAGRLASIHNLRYLAQICETYR